MAGGTEAEVIPVRIEVDAAPVDVAKAKLREAEAVLQGFVKGARVPLYIEVQTDQARASVRALKDDVKALEKAQKDANAQAVKAFQYQRAAAADADKAAAGKIKDLFGTSVMELGARRIAAAFGKGKEETKAIEGALMQGGAALASGAAAAATAALAIGAAGVGLIAAGIKYGIEGTASRIKNQAVLDKLTGGQGEIADDVNKALAAATGIDEDKALERTKGLIQAGFNREETEIVFRASADIGEVKGQGKAEAFLAILEKVQLMGEVTEKSVKGLAGAGVEKSALIEQLKQTGETTEQVEARLKAGKVSAGEFARAASAAVQKDIGGVAGKGLDAMVNRLKIGFDDLFDDMDLGPIETLGGLLNDALSGEDGAKLKAGISEAGTAVLALAKNITAEDIKGAITGIATAATSMAKSIGDAANYAHELSISWKEVSGANAQEGEDIERQIKAQTDRAQIRYEKEQKAKEALAAAGGGVKGDLAAAGPSTKGDDGAATGGNATGKAFADGMAKGVEENAGKPAAAAAAAAAGMTAAGKDAIKSKSPSRVAEEQIGKTFDEGAELGIIRNAGKPAAAAADMMRGTTRAARGASPGLEGAGAAGGGGSLSITVNVQVPPGSPEATKEAARAGSEMALAIVLAKLREAGRLGGVGAGPSLP